MQWGRRISLTRYPSACLISRCSLPAPRLRLIFRLYPTSRNAKYVETPRSLSPALSLRPLSRIALARLVNQCHQPLREPNPLRRPRKRKLKNQSNLSQPYSHDPHRAPHLEAIEAVAEAEVSAADIVGVAEAIPRNPDPSPSKAAPMLVLLHLLSVTRVHLGSRLILGAIEVMTFFCFCMRWRGHDIS